MSDILNQEAKTVLHFSQLFSSVFPKKRKEDKLPYEDSKDSYEIINKCASNGALKPVASVIMYDQKYVKQVMEELCISSLFHSVESEISLSEEEYDIIAAVFKGRNMFVFVKSVYEDTIEKGDAQKDLLKVESRLRFSDTLMYMLPINDKTCQDQWEVKLRKQVKVYPITKKLVDFYESNKID